MLSPEIMSLSACRWDVIGTLTYRRAEVSERFRLSTWVTFMRRMSKRLGIRAGRLLWVLRQEKGERGGRTHNHCLIGGLPAGRVNLGLVFWMNYIWNAGRGGGLARFRLYDHDLPGVEYILKSLGNDSPANFYECQKFAVKSPLLTLSRSLMRCRLVAARIAIKRDRSGNTALVRIAVHDGHG
jgi:hypothetical protein